MTANIPYSNTVYYKMYSCPTCKRETETPYLYCSPFKASNIKIIETGKDGKVYEWPLKHLSCFSLGVIITLIKKDNVSYASEEEEREVYRILGLTAPKSAYKKGET